MFCKLAITMGDPAGIGPEVTVRALMSLTETERSEVLVVGEAERLRYVCKKIGDDAAGLVFLEKFATEGFRNSGSICKKGAVCVCNPLAEVLPLLPVGHDSEIFGEASFAYVVSGARLVMEGVCGALVTAPISKRSWHLAGHNYPGHTELLQEISGSPDVGMMFWGERLKVLLATTHISLAGVAGSLTVSLIEKKIILLYEFMQKVGLSGTIGLAALNPHAGEQGAFGDEERVVLEPALSRLQGRGIPVEGPVPADVLFYQALEGRYGALVALYHDQGLVPFKMIHFEDGVNVSLGLPFFRTSVDHGTAFDIAEKFVANSKSMESAIALAFKLSNN